MPSTHELQGYYRAKQLAEVIIAADASFEILAKRTLGLQSQEIVPLRYLLEIFVAS